MVWCHVLVFYFFVSCFLLICYKHITTFLSQFFFLSHGFGVRRIIYSFMTIGEIADTALNSSSRFSFFSCFFLLFGAFFCANLWSEERLFSSSVVYALKWIFLYYSEKDYKIWKKKNYWQDLRHLKRRNLINIPKQIMSFFSNVYNKVSTLKHLRNSCFLLN